ncbi:MAG: class III extradiol dioxygenase subunit B-like domain-containing protein [Patescibacteria group bacterium]|nr:MAG: class III extradiol dioxygenase subunit B-like domain-containing protein [Patescibacteria group bacterium]
MSLVFASIVPHSPVLLPSVGKEHLKKLKKTITALHRLEQELVASKPDVLLVISPHGRINPDHFTLEVRDRYVPDLKEFGILEMPMQFRSDMRLTSAIKEHLEDCCVPLMLRSDSDLDYGTVVPLTYLATKLNPVAIVPIAPSLLSPKAHFEFGQALQDVLMHSDRRVAVICSADLSHRLTRSSPAGYSPYGRKFDEKVLAILQEKKPSALVTFEPQLAEKAAQCALPSLTILAGILDSLDAAPEILSYESPFGIGSLTAHYLLS